MLRSIITSYKTMLVLMVLYALSMACATFIENSYTTEVARTWVYHAGWFVLLHLLMVVNGVAIINKHKLFRVAKAGSCLFHMSFIVILIGATVTHFWGKEGIMQIREGESSNVLYDNTGNVIDMIPVRVALTDFELKRYPGSHSPSSYTSKVKVVRDNGTEEHVIGMNKVMNIDGYRFFQSSYHPDEKGTILTVNYDFPGMQITYLGYILLLLGFVIVPFQPASRFRQLYKKLGQGAALMLLLTIGTNSYAQLPIVDKTHADMFGKLLVQNPQGRIEPMDSWSRKLMRKIHHSETCQGQSANAAFIAMIFYPEVTNNMPLIYVKNSEIQELLGSNGDYVTFNSFFNSNGEYILTEAVEKASALPAAKQSKFQKDILSVDEVVNIVYQLQQGCYFPLFPNDQVTSDYWASPGDDLSHFVGRDSMFVAKVTHLYAEELDGALRNGNWDGADKVLDMIATYQSAKNKTIPVDTAKIEAELQYNKLNIFGKLFKGYLILGGLLLSMLFYAMLSGKKQTNIIAHILFFVIGALWIAHTYGFGLRWYIAGYAPWSNSYETMLFVAWSVVFIGLIAGRHNKLLTALCSLLGGILLFVASLNWLNPSITPLVPVLQSYWLMIHVAVIMMGYGFFFVCALIGIMNTVLYSMPKVAARPSVKQTIAQSTILNEMSMIAGTAFLAIGIFLGAVWANESWGRYWGWDPKETWALITMIVYAFVLHMRFVPRLNNSYWFNTLSMWSILSVLMTYFGVNYYLSGLHAYGTGGNIGSLLPLTGVLALLGILSFFAYRGFNSKIATHKKQKVS